MHWKHVLVHVDASRAAPARLSALMALARLHGASVSGLHVAEKFEIPGYAEVQIPHQVIEQQAAAQAEILATAERLFHAAADAAEVDATWHAETGDAVTVLARHARWADLVAVGTAVTDDPMCASDGIARHLVLECGRPVLVLPPEPRIAEAEMRAMVAWDASREAARALADALPLLAGAAAVEVVCVDGQTAEHRPTPADICAHLRCHGIAAQPITLNGRAGDAGDLLLEHAREHAFDLLVMGAYGHSRLRETVFGGVTERVLDDGGISALISH